ALDEKALHVGRLAADERADPALGALQSGRGLVERALPGYGPQLAAVADQRPRDPLVGVHGLVGRAPLVAQPAGVDAVGLARLHAQHALVAHGEVHVALRRAHGAHRAAALDVPGPGPEPVGQGG